MGADEEPGSGNQHGENNHSQSKIEINFVMAHNFEKDEKGKDDEDGFENNEEV
jgi:hypothetical protein